MKRHSESESAAFLEANAERMRREPTQVEDHLWPYLEPLGFIRQFPLSGSTKNLGGWNYILDFFHDGLNLCVEVDGSVHMFRKGRDRRRDTRLATIGIVTLRFRNREVLTNIAGVIAKIKWAMNGDE